MTCQLQPRTLTGPDYVAVTEDLVADERGN